MRRSPLSLVLAALGLLAVPAAAQDAPRSHEPRARGVEAARALAACVHREDEQLQRLTRALEQAETRATAPGADDAARREAHEARDAVAARIFEEAREVAACVGAEESAPESTDDDDDAGSLEGAHGTVHVIERDARLEGGVRIVIGERVDGAGEARDEDVRAAVAGLAPRLARCGADARRRGIRAGAEVHVVLRAEGPSRTMGEVEHATGGDDALRSCVGQAFAAPLSIRSQRGRAEYAYVFRFDAP